MPVPATIDDLSTTASSNSPAGGETPKDGDNYLRSLSGFIAELRDKLDGTSNTGTIKNATFSGTMAGAASWSGLQTFASGATFNATATFNAAPAGYVVSSSWTPTYTGVANVNSGSVGTGRYTRVGDLVTFTVIASITPAAPSTVTQFAITVPIASNFTVAPQAIGSASTQNAASFGAGFVSADTTNDRLVIELVNGTSTASRGVYITGQYVIV